MELRRIERLGTCECKSCSSRSLSSQRRKEAPDDRRMSAQPRCGVIQSEWRRERSLPRNAHTSRRHLRAVRTSLHGSRPGAQAKFGKLGRGSQHSLGQDQPCALSFACRFCGYRSSILADVVEHQQMHTNELPFSCQFCPAKFTEMKNLTQHLRSHAGEKLYKCVMCSMAFAGGQKHECYRIKKGLCRWYKSEYL
ncbi:hypothetical protein HPB52_005826 [Rhipicephalus sanguineus]|uniref:C2H2-type domain-containing protein n=1 Tax=Rhipicephalus sanguineus TaxID=34632 RepID=A0A9D4Q4I0_RHISA|nr:hypothetical protein HPB52_005826 [Rhipicephalus sanguineus]